MPPELSNYKKISIFIAICLMHIITNIDFTATNTLVITISKNLNLNVTDLHWLITSYFVLPATIIMLTPIIAARYGIKITYLVSSILFIIGSGVFALSSNLSLLILGRFIQGSGSAILLPLAIVIVYEIFENNKKTFAISITVTIGALSQAIGPILASFIAHYSSWRVVFLINIPIGLIAAFTFYMLYSSNKKTTNIKINYVNTILLTGALFSFAMLITCLSRKDINIDDLYAGIVFIVLLVIFLRLEYISRNRILKLNLLKSNPRFSLLVLSRGLFSFVYFAYIFILPIQLQLVQHISLIDTSKYLMIMLITFAISAFITGRLSKSISNISILKVGVIAFLLGIFSLYFQMTHTHIGLLFSSLLFIGLSGGIIIPCSVTVILSLVSDTERISASSIYTTSAIIFGGLGATISNFVLSMFTNQNQKVWESHLNYGLKSVYILLVFIAMVSVWIYLKQLANISMS